LPENGNVVIVFTQMERMLASVIVGLCLFLGNISSQAKTLQIVGHLSSEHTTQKPVHAHHTHSHHKHHDHKEAKSKKSSQSAQHQHSTELSQLTIQLALPSIRPMTYMLPVGFPSTSGFYMYKNLNQLSFSPPVFRPPIS
jgi:hypothetical protein